MILHKRITKEYRLNINNFGKTETVKIYKKIYKEIRVCKNYNTMKYSSELSGIYSENRLTYRKEPLRLGI